MVLAWTVPSFRRRKLSPMLSTDSPLSPSISPRSLRVQRIASQWQQLIETDPVKADLLLDWNEQFLKVKNG